MQKEFHKAKIKALKKSRKCMYGSCQEFAIKSHVLQKNGILREISNQNHIIEHVASNPFETDTKGISDFKLIGINNAYSFKGFCSKHDTEIFAPIETNEQLDFNNPTQQALFCYRGLCQEIRRKEISLEQLNAIRKDFPVELLEIIDALADGYKDGLENLNYFKSELENSISNDEFSAFQFDTIKIPYIELCISVPLNVGDIEIPEDNNYEKWRDNKVIPFTTSFINVFPKEGASYLITGYLKKHPCSWTKKFANKIKASKKKEIFKELSDLVTLRLEFWAISKEVYKSICPNDIERFKLLEMQNALNHSPSLSTDINFFENIE